jgi:hypothetical protein
MCTAYVSSSLYRPGTFVNRWRLYDGQQVTIKVWVCR